MKSALLFAWAFIATTLFSYFPGLNISGVSRPLMDISFISEALNKSTDVQKKSAKPRDYKIPDSAGDNGVFSMDEKKPDLPEGRKLVVIDPGHGGKDPGAAYNGLVEKDISLDIALRLDKLLACAGVRTYMTRREDTYVDLKERIYTANNKGAALFISIHSNWYYNASHNGTMTLYYPSRDMAGGKLNELDYAQIIQQNLVKKLDTGDMGVIDRPNLAVLRHANMPSLIAEIGFLSNKGDAKKLSSEAFRQKAAEALAEGVRKALDRIDGK